MTTMRVDIWSDIVCPWCFIGKRRFEAALDRFGATESVEIVWHSYELNPRGPWEGEPERYAARLAEKYRMSLAEAEGRIAQVVDLARAEGLNFDFSRIRTGRTFDAHRLLHFGLDQGIQDAVKERLFRGYFTEGKPISDPAVLLELATEAGLDRADARRVLESDAYSDAVHSDERLAAELGIQGVPFFVVDGKYAVSGAQAPEVLLSALTRAKCEHSASLQPPADVRACGPDECTSL